MRVRVKVRVMMRVRENESILERIRVYKYLK